MSGMFGAGVAVAAVAASYLLGSISFAILVSRVMGLPDPRGYGSRNPGATNVLRSGSKVAALLTLLGDALKGTFAVAIAKLAGLDASVAALCGLAAFVGHLYPIFFRFQGGKGVATFLGVVLIVDPLAGLAACVAWLLTALLMRYSSLASMTAAVLAPLFRLYWTGPDAVMWVLLVMAVVLLIKHQQNMRNLLAGTERKIGQKAAAPPAS